MVPDDPFTADPKAGAVTTDAGADTAPPVRAPPALQLHVSPPEHTEPLRDPDTPAGLMMHSQGPSSGTKTPRRVQWDKESHVVQLEPIPSPNTVNRQNVMHIDAALERHRSNPGRPAMRRMISEDGEGEDEDYDYRLDTGVPPMHHLGGIRSNDTYGQGGEPQSLSDILDDGINRHIDGEANIPLGETDGLPSIPNQGVTNDSAAKNLVRAHTGKWGVLRRRVRGAGAVSNAFGGAADAGDEKAAKQREDAFAARYPEPEEDNGVGMRGHGGVQGGMHGAMGGMPGGASVLSSLLALYNQQNLPGSGATSAASSRPSSIYSSDGEDETPPRRPEPEQPAVRKTGSGWWHPPKRNDSAKSLQEVVINEESRRPSEVVMELDPPDLARLRSERSRSTSSLGSTSGATAGFLRSLKRAKEVTYDKPANKLKAEVDEYDRPKAARSGAGVFGALIQNTQNITGAATPTGATLAPAAARPGYQLNRYTLPSDVPQTASPWRPASRLSNGTARSRPTSVHSSTAVSDGGASPSDMKKVHSSDDMLAMKDKVRNRSGLRLDTLHKMPMQAVMASGQALKTGANTVRNAEKWVMSGGKTPLITPPGERRGDSYFGKMMTEEEYRAKKEREADKKRRRKAKEARKKQEIFIIQHVAAILARQQFLMKLARALMMFGSPSHRLETQLQATARVLELNAQVVYLPGTMLLSFGDDATHTSETKFLKQATGLDLGKLLATHRIYWNVVHDRMSVEQASKDLDMLMTTPVYYSWWQTLIIGGFASSFICVVGFYGSFIDAVVAAPLGALLCGIQMLSARNDMFSNVFEIAVACIISFIAAGLASTGVFCYTALVSGGVVLILPGYIVLCGALELASRNITAGAVRIGYSVIYSLFLGFGISIGAEMFRQITGREVSNANNYTCSNTHSSDLWWKVTPSEWWYFLCCPGFALMLSLRNQQPLFAKELPIMILIACAGWASNHFSARVFVNRSDMTSAIGSFVVGTLGNLYGKLSKGSSFPVTVVGILFQLPSGLSNGGIFNFAVESSSGSGQAYSSGFEVAQQLVSVAIGLTVGLFVSAAVTHPFGGGRRRGSGIFSF